MIGTAAVACVLLLLAHELGLIRKIYDVCADVVACPTCSVMWGTFALLVLTGNPALESLAVAFVCAYASRWLQLLSIVVSRKYNELWQRARSRKNGRARDR